MVMTISMVNAPPPSMTGGRDSVRRCQAYEACEIPEVSIGYAHVTSKYATIPTAIVIPMEGETQTFHLSSSSSLSSRLAKESRHTRIIQFYLNPSELTGKGGRTRESRRFLASLPRKLSIILNDEVARQPTGSTCEGRANDLTSPPASPSGPFPDQLVGDEEDNHVTRKVILEDLEILLNGGIVE